ncbi:MAG: AbrB/MazE/SpoVT family DNA-binding domain-containing protein [Betaproteobacteria bacterium]|nr:AbrB/MazE/SpoVT family DNA-binding domain-containing protein [Betaproteobacteria bacterium]
MATVSVTSKGQVTIPKRVRQALGIAPGSKVIDLVHFMTHYLSMIKLNIHEAKTHLSRYLARLEKGETIILCRRNTPIAEIRALPAARKKPRPLGLGKGKFKVPDSFFDPLPDDLLDLFEGKGE